MSIESALSAPAVMRPVTEVLEPGEVPLWRHPEWIERFPWLVQGVTGRDGPNDETGFGLFGSTPVGTALDRWRRLRATTALTAAVHSRQVHGDRVEDWPLPLPSGLMVTDGADAHVTRQPGILLTVSVADCVPIFLLAEAPRVVAIVHAGWRGVAAGVFERAFATLIGMGAIPAEVHVHCGPAICGGCYEVGPEVHEAVRPGPGVFVKAPIDLRAALAQRAAGVGVSREHFTSSTYCTLHGSEFFSHRGGSSGRQVGAIGIRR